MRACLNESLATEVVGARRQFWRTGWTRRPLQSAGFLITNYARLIWREVRPPGILVAVLGPDGVGKTTVIARADRLSRARDSGAAKSYFTGGPRRFS